MKFAAFGRTQILYDSILACVKQGHKLVLLGTSKASPEYTKKEDDFGRLAEKLSAPFFNDTRMNQAKYLELAHKSSAEIAISMNWQTLINKQMIDLFPYGIINAHPGDLPRYRGNACPNWAIIAGEPRVVVTLHQMTPELDAGPICLKREMPLNNSTYIGDVYRFLENNIPQMFCEVLDGFEHKTLIPVPQPVNAALSLRVFPRLPRDSEIDWNKPAIALDRLVRASAEPFSGAYTWLDGKKLIIWRAHASQLPYPYMGTPGQVAEINRKNGEVSIITGEGVLALEIVEGMNVKRQKAAETMHSARTHLGLDTLNEIQALREEIVRLENRLNSG
jgi:methionyl-tRNA formyltransferase